MTNIDKIYKELENARSTLFMINENTNNIREILSSEEAGLTNEEFRSIRKMYDVSKSAGNRIETLIDTMEIYLKNHAKKES